MQLFIDTNVYLNFYHHTNDDLASLDKLKKHIQDGEIVLHLPAQVRDEWERNRDNKLQAALNEFKGGKFLTAVPRHMQSLSMAKVYADSIKEAQKARDVLIAQAVADARLNKLDVDLKLNEIFECATPYAHDDALFAKGKLRAERGNPPGKAGSFGDQYNWELLLDKLPADDLYIVSKDGDYVSNLTEEPDGTIYPNNVLKREWKELKGGKSLYIFDTIKKVLGHYTKTLAITAAPEAEESKFEAIALVTSKAEAELITNPATVESAGVGNALALATAGGSTGAVESGQMPATVALSQPEQDAKATAIQALVNSSNFASTHQAISQLTPFQDTFSNEEVNALSSAALTNNQIRWIIDDDDVKQFYLNLFSKYLLEVNDELLGGIIDLLGLTNTDAESELAEEQS
jgi:hypothetical protein